MKKFPVNGAIEPVRSGQFYLVDPKQAVLQLVEHVKKHEFFLFVGPRGSGKTTTALFLLQYLVKTMNVLPVMLNLTIHCSPSKSSREFWSSLSTAFSTCARRLGIEIEPFYNAAGFQDALSSHRTDKPRFVLMIDEFDSLKLASAEVREEVRVLVLVYLREC